MADGAPVQSAATNRSVQSLLSLFMPLASPSDVPAVLTLLQQHASTLGDALNAIRTVHFARFMLLNVDGTETLVLFTEYDGDFATYVKDFVAKLGPTFDAVLAYGPPYNPAQPNDRIERGLVGLFINVSIADQFEFVMQNWVNNSLFAGGLNPPAGQPTREVLLGNNTPDDSYFEIPNKAAPSNPTSITGFSRLVTTRSGAYLFLSSITALRYLADPANFANPETGSAA